MTKKNKKITNLKRKIIRYFCTGMCLSTLAFVFQACYGTKGDWYRDEIRIIGKVVTSADSLDIPVQNIKVSIKGGYISELVDTTNVDGAFCIYVPVQNTYNMRFEGIEPDSVSRFFPKDTIIEKPDFNDVYLNIRLDAR
jgi:hypothetical protein